MGKCKSFKIPYLPANNVIIVSIIHATMLFLFELFENHYEKCQTMDGYAMIMLMLASIFLSQVRTTALKLHCTLMVSAIIMLFACCQELARNLMSFLSRVMRSRNLERKIGGTHDLDRLIVFFGLYFASLVRRALHSSNLERKIGGINTLDGLAVVLSLFFASLLSRMLYISKIERKTRETCALD